MKINNEPKEVTIRYLLDTLGASESTLKHFEDVPDAIVKVIPEEEFLLDLLSDRLWHKAREIAIKAHDRGLLPNWKNGAALLQALEEEFFIDFLDDTKGLIYQAKKTLLVQATGFQWRVTNRAAEVLENLVTRRLYNPNTFKALYTGKSVEKAEEMLLDLLNGGQQPLEYIMSNAKDCEISWSTLRKAKANLKVRSIKEGFPGRIVAWMLPKR